MLPTYHRGFTLLEVLLAGFILFLTIATTTSIYRGAILSSEKAQASLSIAASVSPIRQMISDGFTSGDYAALGSGSGSYGALKYKWQATLTHSGVAPSIVQDASGMGEDLQYYLWRVELEVLNDSTMRKYEFTEVSW